MQGMKRMNTQNNKPGGHGLPFEILKWGLLIYSGYRSFDILSTTAGNFNMIFVIVGLLGLDGGALVWSHLYEKKAEGNQATLAALLTVVDIVGVGLAMIADMLLHSKMGADYGDFIGSVSVWVVGAIMFLNIVGGLVYPMLSPAAERARKEKELEAEYSLKARAAEHDLKLAQLELANARTSSQARALRLQATDTLFVPPAGDTGATPNTQMAKAVPDMMSKGATGDHLKVDSGELWAAMQWIQEQRAKGNGGADPK